MKPVRDELRHRIAALSDPAASRLLDYARWLEAAEHEAPDGFAPTEEEVRRVREGARQLREGDHVDLDDLLVREGENRRRRNRGGGPHGR